MSFFEKLFDKKSSAKEELPPRDDDTYGRMVWDASDGSWRGTYVCPGTGEFALTVPPASKSDLAPSEELKAFFRKISPQFKDAKKRVIDEFLSEEYAEWRDGEELSFDECSARLKPHDMIVWDYGSIEVSFASADEDDILCGHELILDFGADGSAEVKLEG
jgi:hypothetical protein